MKLHSTIIHNFCILLRLGAFGLVDAGDALQPMSPHKWRKMLLVAEKLHVRGYVMLGARQMADNPLIYPFLTQMPAEQDEYDLSHSELFNHWTQRHLEEVREEEMNAPDTSESTLILLDHIVANANAIISSDVSIHGMISLGVFLQRHNDEIDHDKLRHWLSQIGLVQLASLQANMLIDAMGVSPDLFPFRRRPYRKARKLFMQPIEKAFDKHSFSHLTRLNVALVETLSKNFVSSISLVTDIEE